MHNFTFKIAGSPQLLEEIYRLRFQVYVKEHCFIAEEDCLDRKETDKFDKHSIHLVALDKRGFLAGAVRLVLDSVYGFPLEERCSYPLFINKSHPFRKERDKNSCIRENLAEISRLVINKNYRIGQWGNPYRVIVCEGLPDATKELRCRVSPILFGLYERAYQESRRRNITHWCAAMEDSLFKLVNTYGFVFRPMGNPINYYGKVTPCLGKLEEIQKSMQGLKLESEDIFYKFPERV